MRHRMRTRRQRAQRRAALRKAGAAKVASGAALFAVASYARARADVPPVLANIFDALGREAVGQGAALFAATWKRRRAA